MPILTVEKNAILNVSVEKNNLQVAVESNNAIVSNNILNVIVGRKREVQTSLNATGGIIDTTTPVTLRNTPTLTVGSGIDRLNHLKDVDAAEEQNGSLLVYDANSLKWIAQTSLDGGNF